VTLDWGRASLRRRGMSERPTLEWSTAAAPLAWLAPLAESLYHAATAASVATCALVREGGVAVLQRAPGRADDGTGRPIVVVHVHAVEEPDPERRADAFGSALCAWLAARPRLLRGEASEDDELLVASCATAAAVEGQAESLGYGLTLLRQVEGTAAMAAPTPADAPVFVRAVRAALRLCGDRLDLAVVADVPSAADLHMGVPAVMLEPGAPSLPVTMARMSHTEALRARAIRAAELRDRSWAEAHRRLDRLDEIWARAVRSEDGRTVVDIGVARQQLADVAAPHRGPIQDVLRRRLTRLRSEAEAAGQVVTGGARRVRFDSGARVLDIVLGKGRPSASLAEAESLVGSFSPAARSALAVGMPAADAVEVAPARLSEWEPPLLAWLARERPQELRRRWGDLRDAADRRATALRVIESGPPAESIPLTLLAEAGTFPDGLPLAALLAFNLEGQDAWTLADARQPRFWIQRLAQVWPLIGRKDMAAWAKWFGSELTRLRDPVPVPAAIARALWERLEPEERSRALVPLFRCCPSERVLQLEVLREMMPSEVPRPEIETLLPEPDASSLRAALDAATVPGPKERPTVTLLALSACGPRAARRWRYIWVRARLGDRWTPPEVSSRLVGGEHAPAAWQTLAAWPEGRGRDAVLLDLWLHGGRECLRGQDLPAGIAAIARRAIEQRLGPCDQAEVSWDEWGTRVRSFIAAQQWLEEFRRAPVDALVGLRDQERSTCALRWDVFAQTERSPDWPQRVWHLLGSAPLAAQRLEILATMPSHLRLRMVDASGGDYLLEQALARP
jgi:hypothetical protein